MALKVWRETLHSRVAVVLIALHAALLLLLPGLLKGDGTLLGQLQLEMSYSYRLTAVMLCLIACFLSIDTLRGEIDRKELHLLMTKPVSVWQLLAGKWLGIASLLTTLLVVLGGCAYLQLQWRVSEARAVGTDVRDVFERLLVARREISFPPLVDDARLAKLAEEEFVRRRTEGKIPPQSEEQQVRYQIMNEIKKWSQSVPPHQPVTWRVTGLDPSAGESFQISYKHEANKAPPFKGTQIRGQWLVRHPVSGERETYSADATEKTEHEFSMPARLIAPDGSVEISFFHNTPALAVFKPGSLLVRQRTGGFAENYVKAHLVLCAQVTFIVALGLGFSAFASMPVANLLVYVCMFMALFGGFFAEMAIPKVPEAMAAVQAPELMNNLSGSYFSVVFSIFPNFSRIQPLELMATGREVPTLMLVDALGWLLLLRGGLWLAFSGYILRRREIAMPS